MSGDLRLSRAAWSRMNWHADRISPLDRGRFFVTLADALAAHLDASGRRDRIGVAVAAELAMADALSVMHGLLNHHSLIMRRRAGD